MKQISGIHHVGLRVRDLEVARTFYEKLGFIFIIGPVGPEPVAVMEHPVGININFILNATPDGASDNILADRKEKHTGYTHIAIEIDDLDAVKEQLAEHDVNITDTIDVPNGPTMIFIRDPDKNVIELHYPAS